MVMNAHGRVSMVMPCYNKVNYIGEMFDSILVQKWDNIELILVNDGSTDGTRDVITEYEPKFMERGYKTIVIDQENAGVCAAAKAGLERVTGKYVCVVDADDELSPKYVSTMAGWLEAHPEYDFTTCDFLRYTSSGDKKEYKPSNFPVVETDAGDLTEKYLLHKMSSALWAYMVRADYLHKCRIVENYNEATKGTHEPSFMIPLTAYEGRMKSFSEPLYHFNVSDSTSHSRPESYEKMHEYYQTALRLQRNAISLLPEAIADDSKKTLFLLAAELRFLKLRTYAAYRYGLNDIGEPLREDIAEFFNRLGLVGIQVKGADILSKEKLALRKIERVFEVCYNIGKGRFIGYGVMGKAASKWIPLFKEKKLELSEMWDIRGDGVTVKKPDFESLSKDDIVLFFPKIKPEGELQDIFTRGPFRVIYNKEFTWFLSYFAKERLFGDFITLPVMNI